MFSLKKIIFLTFIAFLTNVNVLASDISGSELTSKLPKLKVNNNQNSVNRYPYFEKQIINFSEAISTFRGLGLNMHIRLYVKDFKLISFLYLGDILVSESDSVKVRHKKNNVLVSRGFNLLNPSFNEIYETFCTANGHDFSSWREERVIHCDVVADGPIVLDEDLLSALRKREVKKSLSKIYLLLHEIHQSINELKELNKSDAKFFVKEELLNHRFDLKSFSDKLISINTLLQN